MPELSTPNGRPDVRPHKQTFLSPRKSLFAVGVVCALSAAALWVGRAPDVPRVERSVTPSSPPFD